MKKILILGLSIILVLCTLVGCGAKGADIISKEDTANKEAVNFFLNICNAKGSVNVTTESGVNQTVEKKDVKTKGSAQLIMNSISQVDVSDRWTATYNCNKVLPTAKITIKPSDKDNPLLSVNWHFGTSNYNLRSNSCESITTSPSGETILNKNTGAFRLSYTDNGASFSAEKRSRVEYTFNGTVDGDVTFKVSEDGKLTVSADKTIKNFSVDCFDMYSENHETNTLTGETESKTYIVSIDKDGKPTLTSGT